MAGINCQPYRESYVMTKRVTCMVDSPGVNDFKEGPIVVKVKGVGLQEVAGGGQQLVTYFSLVFFLIISVCKALKDFCAERVCWSAPSFSTS